MNSYRNHLQTVAIDLLFQSSTTSQLYSPSRSSLYLFLVKCCCSSIISLVVFARGSKDLKIYTGSVNFFKPWYVTPPPLLPKIDKSDRKRQFQEKHIAFLVLKKWEKYENISVCLYKLQKGIFGTQLVWI